MKPETAVAGIALVSSGVGLVAPYYMLMLWPADRQRHLRLMQAWSLSTLGLGAVLLGTPPKRAVAGVCLGSVPWDLHWGGTMGAVAATINLLSVFGLVYL